MNYIIPQEYRVVSREAYMVDFWAETEERNGYADGKAAGRKGYAPTDSGVHPAAYHEQYAAGYAEGHEDFRANGSRFYFG